MRPPRRHHYNDIGSLNYDDTTDKKKDSIDTRPLLPCTPTTHDYSTPPRRQMNFRRYLSVSSVRRRRQMNYSRRAKYQIQLKRNDETSFTAIPTHLETFVRSRGYHRCRLVSCLRPPGFTPAGLPALDGTSVSPLKTRRVGGTVQWQQACWDAVCKHSVISFKFQIFRTYR